MVFATGGSLARTGSVIINTFFAPRFTQSNPTSAVTPDPYRMFEHAICEYIERTKTCHRENKAVYTA